jgi:UDP-N-acetylglucosamine:LPS N-acetylglucosamine transferase
VLIDRKDTDPHDLAEALEKLMQKSTYREMSERAGQMAKPDAAERILDEVIRRSIS